MSGRAGKAARTAAPMIGPALQLGGMGGTGFNPAAAGGSPWGQLGGALLAGVPGLIGTMVNRRMSRGDIEHMINTMTGAQGTIMDRDVANRLRMIGAPNMIDARGQMNAQDEARARAMGALNLEQFGAPDWLTARGRMQGQDYNLATLMQSLGLQDYRGRSAIDTLAHQQRGASDLQNLLATIAAQTGAYGQRVAADTGAYGERSATDVEADRQRGRHALIDMGAPDWLTARQRMGDQDVAQYGGRSDIDTRAYQARAGTDLANLLATIEANTGAYRDRSAIDTGAYGDRSAIDLRTRGGRIEQDMAQLGAPTLLDAHRMRRRIDDEADWQGWQRGQESMRALADMIMGR